MTPPTAPTRDRRRPSDSTEHMSLIDTLKGLFEDDSGSVGLYVCGNCSNNFTKADAAGSTAGNVRCPNCDSADVEMAVSAN